MLPLPAWCWSLSALSCLLATSLASAEPARVPKVYNALITSSQNLAPSRSFPVYQPFYQDAYGLPYPPSFYYDDHFKNFFGDSGFQRRVGSEDTSPGQSGPPGPAAPLPADDQIPPKTESQPGMTAEASPPAEPNTPPKENQPSPPPQPATQSPIPLNEFGLPPALHPLTPGSPGLAPTYSYDPFARFTPYYSPYDPYLDPYSYQSYPLLPPLYRFGDPLPLPPTAPPAVPKQPPSEPAAEQPDSPAPSDSVPPASTDLSLNNFKKDPAIPDVPPPPVPSDGFKDEQAKTNE